MGGEVEGTPLARFALYLDLATHEFHQPLADGESESRAPVTAGGRGVGLGERLEELLLLLGRHADAGVLDLEVDHCLFVCLLR